MLRNEVISSNLQSVGYENGVLEIEFHSGGVYQYYGVPEAVYIGLINASSHGSYFDANVKKAGYRYVKIL